jgi:hypothetical protein
MGDGHTHYAINTHDISVVLYPLDSQEEYGDVHVPTKFVVPSSAPWAEEAWGMRLGRVVYEVRHNGQVR